MPRINPLMTLLLAAVASLVALVALLPRSGSRGTDATELMLFCAAGMQAPIEKIREEFEKECGIRVSVQYGGSNTLLSSIEASRQGDLFLAADQQYLDQARQLGLVKEILPLAQMQAVVIVPRGNPAGIESLDDLLAAKVALANPEQAAVGKAVRDALEPLGKWGALAAQVQQNGVFKPTVKEVATDVAIGGVDAGIVWDAVAAQFADVDVVAIPELKTAVGNIGIGVVSTTRDAPAALKFCRFAAARDRGLPAFSETGYGVVDGDPWQESPELILYAGAVNFRALSPIIEAFQQREGVTVLTKFNGCGILNADIKGMVGTQARGQFPDAYVPCDRMYLAELGELFDEESTISSAAIVIVTAKGNPKQIEGLSDLAKPGVRVTLGQPEQCTIGKLSRTLLEQTGLYDQIADDNLVTQTTSSSLLVPAITTGAADAALVYATDAQAEQDRLEIIAIDSPLAMAQQSFGVSRRSEQKQLAGRLFEAIKRSRKSFESAGFEWELDE